MKIYLPDAPAELKGELVDQILYPFNSFLPMANAEVYIAGGSRILIQRLRSELFSIAIYEAFSEIDQPLVVSDESPGLILLFSLQGDVHIQQVGRSATILRNGRYSLMYCPANQKFAITLPEGRLTIFQIDFEGRKLGELSADYPSFQSLLGGLQTNSPLGRQLQQRALDSYILWNIRQIFEYGETWAERSLFIHSRSMDLLRYYFHSSQTSLLTLSGDGDKMALQMKGIADFIEEHLATPLSMESLARTFGISVRSLERYFGVYVQQSIGKFILTKRMNRAKDLLAGTSLQLLDIALMVGYSELTNFSRAFKAFYGYLPSQVRK